VRAKQLLRLSSRPSRNTSNYPCYNIERTVNIRNAASKNPKCLVVYSLNDITYTVSLTRVFKSKVRAGPVSHLNL